MNPDYEPKSHTRSKINTGSVGKETPVSPSVVQMGGSAAEAAGNPLRGAVQHLHSEHPHPYTDHGPHHGGTEHIRHESVSRMMGRKR